MAVRFDAESDGYTTTANVPNTNGAFTISWWCYISVDRNGYSTIVDIATNTSNYCQIGPQSDGTTFGIADSGNGDAGGPNMAVGTWYCFAITQTGSGTNTRRLYYGTDPSNLTVLITGSSGGTFSTLRLGKSIWGGEWFNGRMAAFKQWSAALSAAEVGAELAQFEHIRTTNFVRRFDFKTAQTTPSAGTGNLTAGTTTPTTEADPPIPDTVSSPITVDVPPVDITTTPLAPTVDRAVVARPDPVDVVVTPQTPTVEFTADVQADPPPVDIAVEVLPVDGAKIVDVPPVDIQVTLMGVDPGRYFEVPPVDIVHSHPLVSVLNQDADPVEVSVAVLPVDAAKIVDVPPVDIVVEAADVYPGKFYDVPPVDVEVTVGQALPFIMDSQPVEIDVEVLPVTVGYSTDTTAAQRGIPPRIIPQPTRVLARSIISGQWLHMDLPIEGLEITKNLSGPQRIAGYFSAEIRDLADAGLEPWGTWIYVEENGSIRGSGILQPTKVDGGEQLALEAIGVSAYPSGIPYLGPNVDLIQADPADIIRLIWAHLQSYSNAPLGVEVVGTTPARVGEPEPPEDVEFVTGDGQQVTFQSGGPYTLRWYEGTDCGTEIDNLAKEGPCEYTEREFWNDPIAKDYVRNQIVIHYPRAGSRRADLSFEQGENIIEAIGPEETAGTYASEVVLLGKGEGVSKVRGYAGKPLGGRIRRVAVLDRKTVDNTTRANAISAEDLARRLALLDIPEFVVQARHPNARLGSYDVGDDVPVIGDVPWAGRVNQFQRILSYTYRPDQEIVTIRGRRSESFTYGGGQ